MPTDSNLVKAFCELDQPIFPVFCFFPSCRQTTVLWGRQELDTTEHALTRVIINLTKVSALKRVSASPLLLLLFLHGTGRSRKGRKHVCFVLRYTYAA